MKKINMQNTSRSAPKKGGSNAMQVPHSPPLKSTTWFAWCTKWISF